MTLIDGDRIVTAQLYDGEHEEFIEEKMSIIDYVNMYTTEGVTTADDVLDKIRTEIEQVAEEEAKIDKKWAQGVKYALKIIDKYKAEVEPQEGKEAAE